MNDLTPTVRERFQRWLDKTTPGDGVREELERLRGMLEAGRRDEAASAIHEAFYRELEFGTGGLRGILGAGTDRMNIYTIGKVTQGLADYVLKHYPDDPSVAISCDTRIMSTEFACTSARILASNGIRVYIYPGPAPTPMLSFAVRYHKAKAGIMVTASHNPSSYNGYKVYNDEGCQLTNEAADEVLEHIRRIDPFDDIPWSEVGCTAEGMPLQTNAADNGGASAQPTMTGKENASVQTTASDSGSASAKTAAFIETIGAETVDAYHEALLAAGVPMDASDIEIVYTPLNGSALTPVLRVLEDIGVGQVHVVESQREPDGNFPTCPYPNPEKKEALAEGLALCEKLRTPDVLMATDPDGDRIGIAISASGAGWKDADLFTGNEVGILLLDFLCANKPCADDAIVVKTIVTSDMVREIVEHCGLEMREVLTGFKYIGEIIGELEKQGLEDRYFFGFEESYGYLAGSYVRDKDAVNAAMLIAQMVAHHKAQGQTLRDRLTELYDAYGYYVDEVVEFAFEGSAGMTAMADVLARLRSEPPKEFGGSPVVASVDYAHDDTGLPASEVLRYTMANGSGLIVRPSGTEPKLKIYLSAKEGSREASLALTQSMKQGVSAFIE
ncbi:MAG: phospho-sugar mutase [Anaerovoracaceae bacterium]